MNQEISVLMYFKQLSILVGFEEANFMWYREISLYCIDSAGCTSFKTSVAPELCICDEEHLHVCRCEVHPHYRFDSSLRLEDSGSGSYWSTVSWRIRYTDSRSVALCLLQINLRFCTTSLSIVLMQCTVDLSALLWTCTHASLCSVQRLVEDIIDGVWA